LAQQRKFVWDWRGFYGFGLWEMKFLKILHTSYGIVLLAGCLPRTLSIFRSGRVPVPRIFRVSSMQGHLAKFGHSNICFTETIPTISILGRLPIFISQKFKPTFNSLLYPGRKDIFDGTFVPVIWWKILPLGGFGIPSGRSWIDIPDSKKYFLDMGRCLIPGRKTIWNPD
jgi:hypothetical protein